MSLLSRILGRDKAEEKGLYRLPVTGGILNDGPGLWNWWQTGRNIQHGGGDTSIVHACVDAYAQTIASLYGEHYVYTEEKAKKLINSSALARCLHQPNEYQTRSDFMLNLVKNLLMSGNAYVLGARNHRNEFTSLHIVPSANTQPYIEPDTKSVFYAIGENPFVGNLDVMVPSRDIMHIRLFCPRHPLIGASPIEHAASSIAANGAITTHQATFFNNMSRPSGVLSTDMNLNVDQMTQLRKAWEAQSSQMNSGRIPILGSGIKWEPMSLNSQDAQLVQAFQMTVEDVARAFRVPLPLVGDYRHATYNNVEQLISSWLSTGLGFVLEHIELSFDKFFSLPRGQFTEFDVDALLRTDFSSRVDGYTKAIQQGLMTPNEARARMGGLPPVDHGDTPYVQQQMVPLGYEPPKPEAPAVESEPDPVPEEIDIEAAKNENIYFLKGLVNG